MCIIISCAKALNLTIQAKFSVSNAATPVRFDIFGRQSYLLHERPDRIG